MCCSTHKYNFIEKIEILTRDVVKHVIRTTCCDLRQYYNMIFKLVLCFLSSSLRSHNWLDENHIKSQILRYPIYPSLEKSFFLPLKNGRTTKNNIDFSIENKFSF